MAKTPETPKAESDPKKNDPTPPVPASDTTAPPPNRLAIADLDELADARLHVGLQLDMKTSGGPSSLVVADVTGVKNGTHPIYITDPLVLKLEKLEQFLTSKGISIPEEVKGFLDSTELRCDAFYYSTPATLVQVTLAAVKKEGESKGIIESLTDSKELGELFEIESGTVRVLKCEKTKVKSLEDYVAMINRHFDD